MGGFIEAVEADTADITRGPQCSVGLLIRSIGDTDPDLAEEVRVAIEDRLDLTSGAISRQLAALGHDLHRKRVERHRRRDCRCRPVAP